MSVISRRTPLPIFVPAMAAVLAALTMTACASTSGSSSGGKVEREEAAAASNSTSTVPAVTNATNLNAKPSIAAGKPPAPTTLQTRDLVVGTGATAGTTNTVSVRYVGVNYADGKEFDSSWTNQGTQPVSFPLSGVIQGFAQGIVGMKTGGRREIVIPPELGYGASGQPPAVGPNETLVFVVDLVKVS